MPLFGKQRNIAIIIHYIIHVWTDRYIQHFMNHWTPIYNLQITFNLKRHKSLIRYFEYKVFYKQCFLNITKDILVGCQNCYD